MSNILNSTSLLGSYTKISKLGYKNMNKNNPKGVKKLILVFALLFLLVPIATLAYAVKAENSVYVAKGDTVDGNLYAAGSTITVEGKVTGDVYCAGQNININGEVAGDIFCAGQTINIGGNIGGSLYLAGNSINLSGKIAKNAMALGATITATEDSTIGWEMLLAGATAEIRGSIGRSLFGAASSVAISGQVAKDVNLKIDDRITKEPKGVTVKKDSGLVVSKSAKIGGNLVYRSNNLAIIEQGATIAGTTTHNLPTAKAANQGKFMIPWFWGRIFSIFSSLVLGLVLISLWRDEVKKIIDGMMAKIWPSIGWGLIVMILTPIVGILLLITVIGIPLSLIMMGLWLIAITLSRILVGILIGREILKYIWKKQKDSLIWSMVIGIVVTYIIYSLPFIGWLLALVAVWYGLGVIWLYFKK